MISSWRSGAQIISWTDSLLMDSILKNFCVKNLKLVWSCEIWAIEESSWIFFPRIFQIFELGVIENEAYLDWYWKKFEKCPDYLFKLSSSVLCLFHELFKNILKHFSKNNKIQIFLNLSNNFHGTVSTVFQTKN